MSSLLVYFRKPNGGTESFILDSANLEVLHAARKSTLVGDIAISYGVNSVFEEKLKNVSHFESISLSGNPSHFFYFLRNCLLNGFRVDGIETMFEFNSNVGWISEKVVNQTLEMISMIQKPNYNNPGANIWPSSAYECQACTSAKDWWVKPFKFEGVDILIPTRNVDIPLLADCLNSIEASASRFTHDFELVLVDDNDYSLNEFHLRSFFTSDLNERLSIFRGYSKGVGAARNLAIAKSRRSLVSFVDSDDLVKVDFYSKIIPLITKFQNIGAVGTWLETFGGDSRIIPQWDNFFPISTYSCLPPAGVLTWRRQVIENLGGFREIFHMGFEDFDLVARATIENIPIVVHHEALYRYRRGHTSLSQTWNTDTERELRSMVLTNLSNICRHGFVELVSLIDRYGTQIALNEPSLTMISRANRTTGFAVSSLNKLRRIKLLRKVFAKLPVHIKLAILGLISR